MAAIGLVGHDYSWMVGVCGSVATGAIGAAGGSGLHIPIDPTAAITNARLLIAPAVFVGLSCAHPVQRATGCAEPHDDSLLPISELGAARRRVNSVSISSAEATALYQTERGQQQFEPTRPPDADDAALAEHAGPLAQLTGRRQATPTQIAVMPPSPGTGSIEHVEENVGQTGIELSPDEMHGLGKLG